jgi:hypothetical protein
MSALTTVRIAPGAPPEVEAMIGQHCIIHTAKAASGVLAGMVSNFGWRRTIVIEAIRSRATIYGCDNGLSRQGGLPPTIRDQAGPKRQIARSSTRPGA